MSHFTVAVFTEDPDDVDDALEPFCESLEVEPYLYKTYEEIEKEYIEAHSEHLPDVKETGDITDEYMKMFKVNVDKKRVISWAEDWYGLVSDEEGNFWSTCNPKSKWDWYQEGGRWDGMLLTKTGEKVNRAQIKNIDWDGMNNNLEARETASKDWDNIISGQSFHNPEYYIKRYGNKENYIKSCCQFGTFAILDINGEWHEPGRMGWFGSSSATIQDEKDWDNNYYNTFIKDANPELWLVVVDCHI